MRKVVGLCGGFILSAAVGNSATPAAAQEPSRSDAQVRRTLNPDPEVLSGALPNGMRYFVRRSKLPIGGLSMRLGFDVGSFEERDDERGFAHFVEHLAFRRIRSAPAGGLDSRFAQLGVAFGRDQNAQTTQFETTYRLDFNTVDAKGMTEGFRWLRDVADGIIFSKDVIASEHGVVLAEQVAGADEAMLAQETILRFQAPELRSTFRSPNGLPNSLGRVQEIALKGFYERWYRPENAVLIVVGDRPPAELKDLIHSNFTSWLGKGPRPSRAPLGKVRVDRGLDALTLGAPSLPKVASACRLRPPFASNGDEMSRMTREIRRSIWQGIINKRFERIVNGGKGGMLGGAVVGDDNKEFAATCLIAMPTGDAWQTALAATQLEFQRFGKGGPTELEIEAQVEEQRAVLRGAVSSTNAQSTPALANSMLERALERRAVISPAEAMHAYNVAVEDLDPAAVKAAFDADWSGSGPLLMLTLPTKATAATLRESWLQNVKGVPLTTYADLPAAKWPYVAFGTPGTVVSREEIARPGFRRIRFSNGVILNFKRLTSEPNWVGLRTEFGGGRRQIADDDYVVATLGSGMLIAGGLGRLPVADIERAFRNISWQFEFDIRTDSFQFSQSSLSQNLPNMLQVFTAFLIDPGFRSDSDARVTEALDMVVRNLATDPQASLSEAMRNAVDPNNPERLPSPEKFATLKSSEFARVLKASITSDPIEVTIAGDIEEETAVQLVAKTLGALKMRQRMDQKLADPHFLRIPNRAFPVIRAVHMGAADKAAARLIWPLYVATPDRRREEYALQLVAAVFNESLRQKIRSELGKTYSPQVATYMPDYADQGYLAADFASTPADIDVLITEARKVATRLASGGITSEEVEAVRQPKLSSFSAMRGKSNWWVSAMSGSARDPRRTDELTDYQGLMASVSLEEVKAAAAKWLSGAPIVGTSLPRQSVQSAHGGSGISATTEPKKRTSR